MYILRKTNEQLLHLCLISIKNERQLEQQNILLIIMNFY